MNDRFFSPMGVKIFSGLILTQAEAGELREFADQPARIGQVAGDADAIESMVTVKIDHLGHGQFAIRIIGVNVKIRASRMSRAAVLSPSPKAAVRMSIFFIPGRQNISPALRPD